MLVQVQLEAQVVNTFENEFEDKDSKGQKVKYYNLGIMTESGLATFKCNKDVFEAVKSELIKPMSKCICVGVYDTQAAEKGTKNPLRIVALALRK